MIFSVTCEQLEGALLEKYQPTADARSLLIELHYLPCLDYVAGLLKFGSVWLEAHEHYQKQSYRNRCYVRTANGVDGLTVPVLHQQRHQPIRAVQIDNSQAWQTHHWRCLQSAYGRSPFFEYYAPELEPLYRTNQTFLFDWNYELLTICLKLMGANVAINLTDCYEKQPGPAILDARSVINRSRARSTYVLQPLKPYQQNFGPDFVPNLSIVDLLFCQGPQAVDYLTYNVTNP